MNNDRGFLEIGGFLLLVIGCIAFLYVYSSRWKVNNTEMQLKDLVKKVEDVERRLSYLELKFEVKKLGTSSKSTMIIP
jgi:hypothetical protein